MEAVLGLVCILAGVLLSVAAYFWVGQVGFRNQPGSRARIHRKMWLAGPASIVVGVVMLMNNSGK